MHTGFTTRETPASPEPNFRAPKNMNCPNISGSRGGFGQSSSPAVRVGQSDTTCVFRFERPPYLHPTGSIWSRWQGHTEKSCRVTRAPCSRVFFFFFFKQAPLRPSLYLTTRADPGHLCVSTSPRAHVWSRSSFSIQHFYPPLFSRGHLGHDRIFATVA